MGGLRKLMSLCAALIAITWSCFAAEPVPIIVASTTSTQDSGLFGYLLPLVRERTGVDAKVVALGTGQALDSARRGDADVVFVHDPEAEARFVAEGHGVQRLAVMYNDFVLLGPASDPARVRGHSIVEALKLIAGGGHVFVSRGDRSGTNQAELRLWKVAGVEVDAAVLHWYRAVGQGMGPALNIASASDAYVVADRATWVGFRNKGTLRVLVEGEAVLRNQYSLILVNPAMHPAVKVQPAQRFMDFLLSTEGQKAIASYRVDGQQLFFPNAEGARR